MRVRLLHSQRGVIHTPMPNPYVFQSESELVDMLHHDTTLDAARAFFSTEVATVKDVVLRGVASNTYRAFSHLPVRPSVTFRAWATSYLEQSYSELAKLAGTLAYSAYVHEATLALCDHWRRCASAEMGYGRGAKLVNLVLKELACLRSLSAVQRRTLIELAHVPLDSYTIVGLRVVAPELSIPPKATMSYVHSRDQYVAFQERIAGFARRAGVPPIYYDILAWNRRH